MDLSFFRAFGFWRVYSSVAPTIAPSSSSSSTKAYRMSSWSGEGCWLLR